MISTFVKRRLDTFRKWWNAPATPKDRYTGALVGGMAGFWIGLLGRLAWASNSVSIVELAAWALGSAVAGVLLGVSFPKPVICLLFPFALTNISGS